MGQRAVVAATASVAAAACASAAAAPYLRGVDAPWPAVVVHVLVATSFVTAGTIAWWRRPANRTGPLMVAVGLLWLVSDLVWLHNPVADTTALAYTKLYQVVLGHLALAYPTGRLHGRAERRLIGVTYAWSVVNNPVWLTVYDSRADCSSCAENLLFIGRNPALESFFDGATFVVSTGLMLTVGVMIVRRWRVSSASRRRVMAPAIWGVGPALVALVAGELAGLLDVGPAAARLVYDVLPLGLVVFPIGLLVGVLRTQLSYAAVGRLVRDLSSGSVVDLQAALARALHDPTLELCYAAGETYVDAEGRPVTVREHPGRVLRRVDVDGDELAVMVLDESVAEESDLVDAVVAAARLAMENARLQAEVRSQLAEITVVAGRMVDAGERERHRIERDLHDGAQQRLLALSLALASERQHQDGHTAEVLDRAGDELGVAITELRELAHGIHPVLLTQEGLGPALRAMAERAGLPVEVSCPTTRLPGPVESAAYFVATEAVSNALRHSHASRVRISVTVVDGQAQLSADDDGVGGADPSRGTGLQGLSDRCAALGGRFSVRSDRAGTTLTASLPCG